MISFRKTLVTKASRESTPYDSPSTSTGFLGMGRGGDVSASKKTFAEKMIDTGLSFQQMHMMYIANTWIRACVDRIVDRTATIRPIVKPLSKNSTDGKISDATKRNMDRLSEFLINPNSNFGTMTDIRKALTRDVLKYDGSGLEIVRGMTGGERTVEVYAVPGDALVINVDKNGNYDKSKAYIQVDITSGKEVASWKAEQIIYFMANPQSNRVYGLSPMETLIQTVTAELYSSDYNLNFFYNNATPRFAVMMEGLGAGQGGAALTRFRKWWDEELKGNPHRPIVIGTENGKISFQKVGMSNEEMQFQQYALWLLVKIMVVYKMQPAVLGLQIGDTLSKVSSDEQFRQFKIDTIQPHLNIVFERLNNQLVWSPKVLDIQDAYIDYDLDVVDKKSQAEWHQIYLQSGVLTINQVRQSLGHTPVPWGDVPYMQNNVAPFGAGPNGDSVPSDPSKVDTTSAPGTSTDTSGAGTAVARRIITINSRDDIKKAVLEESGAVVGWGDVPPEDRIAAIEKLIKERQKFFSTTRFIPETL